MTSLNTKEKQLLFDYAVGITTEKESKEAKLLISVNEEAGGLYSNLKSALVPLGNLEDEVCPDDLAEGTIWRLNNMAKSSQLRLQQLITSEQTKKVTLRSRFWRNFGEIAAVAALILFVSGILLPPLNFARQKSWQTRCQKQLSSIFQGSSSYRGDHDGQLPSVATAAGEPWWKVGYQGTENHSNTRSIWLLVKGDYVDPADFVCPGRSQGRALQFDISDVSNYNDFPARRYVTYSFRIKCDKSLMESSHGRQALMADLNPLFEKLPQNYAGHLKLKLDESLLNINSINHNRHGQNVMFGDGSVNFVKSRNIGILQDDIFTLQNTDLYQGVEVPSCETDAFLAP
ncbi:MAG: hypothetical protein KAS75_08705 [Planctomycetes bacterium]|nr:hypothetical protein [Planctomycetota bacterium]